MPPVPDHGLTHRYDPATCTLRLSGDVVDGALAELRSALDDLADVEATAVTVDLSGVGFFPSTAVGALVSAQSAAARRGQTIRLRSDEGTIGWKILKVTGLSSQTQ